MGTLATQSVLNPTRSFIWWRTWQVTALQRALKHHCKASFRFPQKTPRQAVGRKTSDVTADKKIAHSSPSDRSLCPSSLQTGFSWLDLGAKQELDVTSVQL